MCLIVLIAYFVSDHSMVKCFLLHLNGLAKGSPSRKRQKTVSQWSAKCSVQRFFNESALPKEVNFHLRGGVIDTITTQVCIEGSFFTMSWLEV